MRHGRCTHYRSSTLEAEARDKCVARFRCGVNGADVDHITHLGKLCAHDMYLVRPQPNRRREDGPVR